MRLEVVLTLWITFYLKMLAASGLETTDQVPLRPALLLRTV